MYRFLLYMFCLVSMSMKAQSFDKNEMQAIYEEVKTPYKFGLVVAPQDNFHKFDCPTIYKENGIWYMTYVVYNGKDGLDGRGYETWLAMSSDLLHWKTLGRILSYQSEGWDMNQRGGFPSLIDWNWGGSYRIQTYHGRHWMTYIGGKGTGYEAVREPLNIGMAWTKGNISTAHEWETDSKPLLSINDKDAQWWEKLVQYKSTVYWDSTKTFGSRFVMFYNAGGINPVNQMKAERIGIAFSDNLTRWKRFKDNPVYFHESPGIITGDAQIVKMGDKYVMFYFSAYNPSRRYNAYNTFSVSKDLVHWQDWTGEDLIYPTKTYDDMFAHKSYVVKYDGVVYHFYCGVNQTGQRGIAVATSIPMGRSSVSFPAPEKKGRRGIQTLDKGWTVTFGHTNADSLTAKTGSLHVDLPSNLDDYFGYRQLKHGNLHGSATYSKTFLETKRTGKRYFLFFEGVGSYATVVLNRHHYEKQLIGRTTYTLDVTDQLKDGYNDLNVIVEHPSNQMESPWVCGGCSSEWGFSEGSQPFGIFRPLSLIETDEVRIEPFGVHVWNNETCDSVYVDTEVHNYGGEETKIQLVSKMNLADGKTFFRQSFDLLLKAGESQVVRQAVAITAPHRWNLDDPYLYQIVSMIKRGENTTDEETTPYGIRSVSWPALRQDGDPCFYINGKKTFINGTCEYEHLFGGSHAFSHEQVASRIKMVRQAGFNAFREAHQPHNLEYQRLLDQQGLLFWSQFSAHIWYDTPKFRNNFKEMLRRYIRERRNSPSLVLWGLQNESVLPRDFAEECSEIIREMDPTARSQRAITTCNGGEGTDWNVIQNWSGTYGGSADNYGNELQHKDQLLNGEYGAWRTSGLHGDDKYSEESYAALLEKKAILAYGVRDKVCGHFQWLLVSHENPGRVQPDEALRRIDKVGPFNYKGLFTPWEQPTAGYYMYKSHFVSGNTEPFVYIVSPTKYYSNCDSVAFTTDGRNIHALAYQHGKLVAEAAQGKVSTIIPTAADRNKALLEPAKGYQYLYRVNCGGDAYRDSYGNLWQEDDSLCSTSWAHRFGLQPFLASQGHILSTIHGTSDASLFQYFRWGRHELNYNFNLPNGSYRVELYFVEPWHGAGGGVKTDCEGERIFDVAVNNSVVLNDFDPWAEGGFAGAIGHVVEAKVNQGQLKISFPETKAGEAAIAAIAIAQKDNAPQAEHRQIVLPKHYWKQLDEDTIARYPKQLLPLDVESYPSVSYKQTSLYKWTIKPGLAREYALRFRYKNETSSAVKAHLQIVDSKGIVLQNREITFPVTPHKFKILGTTTGTQINAGSYSIILIGAKGLDFEDLEVQ